MVKTLFIAFLLFASSTAFGKPLTPLRVYLDWFPNVEFSGIFVAKEKGYYEREGIDVIPVFNGLDIIPSVLKGQADIGMDSAHDLIRHIGQHDAIKAFSAQYQLNPNSILVGKDSGISSVRDLKGKTIGVFSDQEYDMFRIMLASNNLKMTDVQFKPVKTFKEAEIIELMRKHEFDAIIAWEFNWTVTFPLLGYSVRVFPGYENGFHYYGIVFFAPTPYIEKNRELLAKFLRATYDGWREVYKDSDAVAEHIVDKYFPKDRYINGSRETTLKQQKTELRLRQRYFQEGVGMSRIGQMSRFKWQNSLEISKRFSLVPKGSELSVDDLYDDRVMSMVLKDGAR